MRINLFFLGILFSANISCIRMLPDRKEVPKSYRGTYFEMAGLVEFFNLFKEFCGDYPKSTFELIESIKVGKCSNGKSFDKSKFEQVKIVDSWGNPVILEKRNGEGEFTLISCGAEWIEVKVNQKGSYLIDSIIKGGDLSPFYNDPPNNKSL